MATLTYVYSDSTAVLGPLALMAEPHSYDLCEVHSERLTAPRGWEVLRLTPAATEGGESAPAGRTVSDVGGPDIAPDDLVALADAVREVARPRHLADPEPVQTGEVARRGHLRVLKGDG